MALNFVSKTRSLRRMSADQRGLIVEAFVLPILIFVGFRVAGVSRTQRYLRRWAMSGSPDNEASRSSPETQAVILSAQRAQSLVKRLAGLEGSCLQRSLTLWTLLLKRGVCADLKVGYRSQYGAIEAHAWLEHQGLLINESLAVASTYVTSTEAMNFDCYLKLEGRKQK